MASKRRVQQHHITYESRSDSGKVRQVEFVVPLYQGEHYIITQIQRLRNISTGFVTALKAELVRLEYAAREIE